ncbi:hypothetical protein SAMN04487785_102417 [Dyella jiangningensis]|uniref:hypothetical protein n=1 Tax=Dyella sp. AtDHG13 TaxID=1938897 RepID=UPI00087ED236|nr:hypothetical protein [Dyella sp. AtDHG13]PXV60689.1 hypothetical protein BDW41_102416 [Dyella sp. AtDHG13]SDJ55214.1 hypothetical protein SAMN04487785_102417 [Dyella jiangningensis]
MNVALLRAPVERTKPATGVLRTNTRRKSKSVVHLGPSPTFKALVFCLGWAGALLVWVGRMAGLL